LNLDAFALSIHQNGLDFINIYFDLKANFSCSFLTGLNSNQDLNILGTNSSTYIVNVYITRINNPQALKMYPQILKKTAAAYINAIQ